MELQRNVLLTVASALLSLSISAQTQSTPPPAPPAATAAAAPAPAATAKNWRFAGVDWTGFLDGYGSLNDNHPTNASNAQSNDLYNFDDRTDQFDLAAAKITFNRDPSPAGVHADLLFGRTNAFLHPDTAKYDDDYLEQAYIAVKPAKAHGAEADFGQFVTSAGAETIEAKDNWNYSRSILFSWAIPYYHFGVRTSMPVTKTWTPGIQLVNGWNNTINNEGGPTAGITSSLSHLKYTWSADFYTGPEKTGGLSMYRNLVDTTVLLTPSTKFNAYINFDYGHNTTDAFRAGGVTTPEAKTHWQGVALAAREQFTATQAFAGRWEVFKDTGGFATGTSQTLQEGTVTYEHKWTSRFIGRLEYRHDWSDQDFFHKGPNSLVQAQSTLTVGMIAIFAPKQ